MAERRMFAKSITESDTFLNLPHSGQVLYFHLCQRADDDGFINNTSKCVENTNTTFADLQMLMDCEYIYVFENGIAVITAWKAHNYIQKDRKRDTSCKKELAMLELDENKCYRLKSNNAANNRKQQCCPKLPLQNMISFKQPDLLPEGVAETGMLAADGSAAGAGLAGLTGIDAAALAAVGLGPGAAETAALLCRLTALPSEKLALLSSMAAMLTEDDMPDSAPVSAAPIAAGAAADKAAGCSMGG